MFTLPELLAQAEAYVAHIGNVIEGDAHTALKRFLEFLHLQTLPAVEAVETVAITSADVGDIGALGIVAADPPQP